MYQIVCNDEILHDLRLENRKVLNPIITKELNKSGTLTFTKPFNNTVDIQKLKGNVKVFQDGNIIFEGRVFNTEKDFYLNEKVSVLGVLDYFNDSIIRPFDIQFNNVKDFLTYLVNQHNSQVDSWKHFSIGEVNVPLNGNIIESKHEGYLPTWTLLKEKLIDKLGGYFTVTYKNDMKYLNYTIESGKESSQVIRFGDNLLDLNQYSKAEEIKTALIPLGKKNEDGTYVTIKSVNNGIDYIKDNTAIGIYGTVVGTKIWEDVTEPSNLLTKAKAYLKECVNLALSIDLKAIDLNLIDVSIESFNLGDYPLIYSKPHNLSLRMQISKMSIYLDDPASNKITIGYIQEGIINNRLNNQNKLQQEIDVANTKITNLNINVNKYQQGNSEQLNKQKQYIMLGV
jgi:hypothetical protein